MSYDNDNTRNDTSYGNICDNSFYDNIYDYDSNTHSNVSYDNSLFYNAHENFLYDNTCENISYDTCLPYDNIYENLSYDICLPYDTLENLSYDTYDTRENFPHDVILAYDVNRENRLSDHDTVIIDTHESIPNYDTHENFPHDNAIHKNHDNQNTDTLDSLHHVIHFFSLYH